MTATRTIRRAALVIAWLGTLGACRSESNRSGRQPPPPHSSRSALVPALGSAIAESPAPAPARTTAPLPSAVVQTLRSLREQRLEIAAPVSPSTLLAFGTARLAQASLDKVTFRDSKHGEVVTEASVGPVRGVAAGADGSLFAVGASSVTRLDSRSKQPKMSPHVTFLPGSRLFPDLEEPSHFFVYYPVDEQLYSYPFESEAGPFLAFDSSVRVDGCTEPMVQLRDNAVVCRTTTGFVRKAPRGSRSEFAFSTGAEAPIRLLPGKRLDEFFAVSKAGEVSHLRLTADLRVLARFRVPAPVYAAAANTDVLAFVLVDSPGAGQARRWTLLVTDFDGRPRLQSELAAKIPGADDDWLAAVVEDKNLAISGSEPLVAVGGASRVTVWDYAQGRELFNR